MSWLPRLSSCLLLLLLPGCGGDMDVFLRVRDAPCWNPTTQIHALELLVAREQKKADGQPVLVPLRRQCIDVQPVPFSPVGLKDTFTARGFVARDVQADQRWVIVIRPFAQPGCEAAALPICLISELIPSGGEREHVDLIPACRPLGAPDPAWQQCTTMGQPPPGG